MVAITMQSGGYAEYAGLSLDAKPTEGVSTGSIFLEVDTSAVYVFDSENETWRELG